MTGAVDMGRIDAATSLGRIRSSRGAHRRTGPGMTHQGVTYPAQTVRWSGQDTRSAHHGVEESVVGVCGVEPGDVSRRAQILHQSRVRPVPGAQARGVERYQVVESILRITMARRGRSVEGTVSWPSCCVTWFCAPGAAVVLAAVRRPGVGGVEQ